MDNANWDPTLEINNDSVDKSYESFINIANSIIAKHAPLKRVSLNKKLKLRAKPQITKGMLISISNKIRHIESIAELKTKLEGMNCTTYLKNFAIQ